MAGGRADFFIMFRVSSAVLSSEDSSSLSHSDTAVVLNSTYKVCLVMMKVGLEVDNLSFSGQKRLRGEVLNAYLLIIDVVGIVLRHGVFREVLFHTFFCFGKFSI